MAIATPEKSAETEQIASEVVASRQRIRVVDPEAYSGFVTDAACRAVGKQREMRGVDVLRAFRAHHPIRESRASQLVPPGARQLSDAAKAAA